MRSNKLEIAIQQIFLYNILLLAVLNLSYLYMATSTNEFPIRIIGENRNTRRTATVTASGELNLEMVFVMFTSGSDMLSIDRSAASVMYEDAW